MNAFMLLSFIFNVITINLNAPVFRFMLIYKYIKKCDYNKKFNIFCPSFQKVRIHHK